MSEWLNCDNIDIIFVKNNISFEPEISTFDE